MSIESITPANPAQVMDAMVEAFGLTWWGRSWPIERSAGQDIAVRSALEVALTAAIGTGGQAITQFHKAGCSDWYDGLPDNEDGRGPYETRTLYSHPAPSGMAVAVKPLKWTKAALDGKFGWLIIRYAQTPFGRYYVEKFGSENYRVSLSEQVLTSILPSSVDEGIAAAQADYERRILSALSQPHPADERAVEALVDKVLDAAGDYMGKQYGNTALHHPTDRARIKAALAQEGR